MKHENPKHKTGDGAGFGRLRAEQARRAAFQHLLRRSHPNGELYIDQVREYAGVQIVFYRHTPGESLEYARIAVFHPRAGMYVLESDTIAVIGDRNV